MDGKLLFRDENNTNLISPISNNDRSFGDIFEECIDSFICSNNNMPLYYVSMSKT